MAAEDEARTKAAWFRAEHLLGSQPIGDLITVIEQTTGVDVAVADAGPDEHGLTMRDPELDVVYVAVARTLRPMRQRSTLAHELAHVLFEDGEIDHSTGWADRSPTEIRADAFARHLLLPAAGLEEVLGHRRDVKEVDLSAVVQRFLVSPAVAAIAWCQTGYITEAVKESWMALTTPILAARYGWSDQYRALQADSNRRRAPQKLLARVIRGYQEGVISAQAIGTLRGLTTQEVEAELRAAGIAPIDHPIVWTNAADLAPVDVDLSDLGDDHPQGTGA